MVSSESEQPVRAVITQSNYLPWRGWFAMVRSVDTLIYLDEVQYTRRDWRNRNLIAGQNGPSWLSIPVKVSGKYHAKISEIECADQTWWRSHQSALDSAYRTFTSYLQIRDELFERLRMAGELKFLSEINRFLNSWLFPLLHINTKCLDASDFPTNSDRSDRLVSICMAAKVNTYISGPAAKAYLDVEKFQTARVNVEWIQYEGLPDLPPIARAERELSVIHLLATLGVDETIRLSTLLPIPTGHESD